MKNKLLILLLAISLAGCGESDGTSVTNASSASQVSVPDSSAESTVVNTEELKKSKEFQESEPPQNNITPAEAKAFAANLLKKITDDEQFVEDAYKLGEYETLKKYTLNDVPEYMKTPYSEVEAKVPFRSPYFPYSDVMSPYTSCDTALTKLAHLSSILADLVREDTADRRKLMRQEKQKYIEARDKCKKRVNMSYEDALKAYNAE